MNPRKPTTKTIRRARFRALAAAYAAVGRPITVERLERLVAWNERRVKDFARIKTDDVLAVRYSTELTSILGLDALLRGVPLVRFDARPPLIRFDGPSFVRFGGSP